MDKDTVLSKLASLIKSLEASESEDFKLSSEVRDLISDIKDDVGIMSDRLSEVNRESKGRKEKLRTITTDLDKKSTELEEVTGKFATLEEAKTSLEEKIKLSDERLTGYHSQRLGDLKSIIEQNNISEKEKIVKYLVGDIKSLDKMSSDDVEANLTELNKLRDLGVLEIEMPPNSNHQPPKPEDKSASRLEVLYPKG